MISCLSANADCEYNADAIKFVQKDNELYPENFYTALLMQGVVADYELIKDSNTYHVPENIPYFGGTTFTWENNALFWNPTKPLKFIKGVVTVDMKGMNNE